MTDELYSIRFDARVQELQTWSLSKLIERRDALGLKMDPKRNYSLPFEIATEELRRIRESVDMPLSGAVLEGTEDDPPGLDANFTPNTALRREMRQYLEAKFGAAEVRALGAFDDYPAADVAGVPWGAQDLEEVEPHWYNKILLNVDPREIRTKSADFIVNSILPQVLEHFLSKNADYGDQHRTGLGFRAEFVGLHRKFAKLKSYFWDQQEMNHESGKEMLMDLIGACFLMLDLIAQEEERERRFLGG